MFWKKESQDPTAVHTKAGTLAQISPSSFHLLMGFGGGVTGVLVIEVEDSFTNSLSALTWEWTVGSRF